MKAHYKPIVMTKMCLLALLISLLPMSTSTAQENADPLGFTVKPAIIEVGGKPGTTVQRTITLESTQQAPLALKATPRGLVPVDELVDKKRRQEYDASAWFKLSTDSFILEAGKPESVQLTIAIPKSASPGGHYASIAFRPMEKIEPTTQNAEIVPEIEALTLITVPGAIRETAELDTNDILPRFVLANQQPAIRFKIRNLGNVHVLPNPRVTIKRSDKIIDVISLMPQLVLPGTEKVIEVPWQGSGRPGRYSLSVDFTYGTQTATVASEPISFVVWPNAKQFIPFALVLAVGLFILFRRRNLHHAVLALAGRVVHRHATHSRKQPDDDISQTEVNDDLLSHLRPSVLGLPTKRSTETDGEPAPKPAKQLSLSAQPAIQKTSYSTDHTTTHIIQTKASTIVRSTTAATTPKAATEPRKIIIVDHSETEAKNSTKTSARTQARRKPAVTKTPKSLNKAEKPQKKSTGTKPRQV